MLSSSSENLLKMKLAELRTLQSKNSTGMSSIYILKGWLPEWQSRKAVRTMVTIIQKGYENGSIIELLNNYN